MESRLCIKGMLVKVSKNNDNENYDSIRNKVLRITHVARNTHEHPGYDECMNGMPLCDLETLEGDPIDFSLYAYELRKVYKRG